MELCPVRRRRMIGIIPEEGKTQPPVRISWDVPGSTLSRGFPHNDCFTAPTTPVPGRQGKMLKPFRLNRVAKALRQMASRTTDPLFAAGRVCQP